MLLQVNLTGIICIIKPNISVCHTLQIKIWEGFVKTCKGGACTTGLYLEILKFSFDIKAYRNVC